MYDGKENDGGVRVGWYWYGMVPYGGTVCWWNGGTLHTTYN